MEESGEALVGANVVIKGSAIGTITNAEGMASFQDVKDGKFIFVISFVGFEEKQISLMFPKDHDRMVEIELKEGEEIEEIVISTTRSSRTIEAIPTRIEAITGEELGEKAAMNSSNLGMLLRETTGVQMQQTSLSSGNLNLKIQGLDGRYTQILRDGFPLYGGFAGGLSIMQIPPLDLKQVELIKGSNSTLYGGGAIAGIVNLVSIVPEDEPELSFMFNQTSALGSTGNLFYAQKYGKIGVSVYSSVYNQVEYNPDNDGFSNIPKARSYTLNPRLFYYLDSDTELNFGLSTTLDHRIGGDMEVLKGNTSVDHVFSEENNSERYSTQFSFFKRTERFTLNLRNSLSYFHRELIIPSYQFEGNQLASFTEVQFSSVDNETSDWQFGANHYYEEFKETRFNSSLKRDYAYNTIGAFVQNTSDLSSSFTMESGFRADFDFNYGSFFLPRLSILYKVNEHLSSRIGGALGYKLPTIFTEDAERLYFRNIVPLNMDEINAETSIGANFDVNYKMVLFDTFTFSINQLFYLTKLDKALVLRQNNGLDEFYYENADGSVLSSGFETNLKFTYSNYKLFFNYAFVNAELQYDNINNQKPLTPKNNAGMVLMYDEEEKWSIGYELYYTGWQFDELYNRKSNYWMMGFMVMRHFERVSLFINFENFTNTTQTNFEPLVLPPFNTPTFSSIWVPSDGFVFNAGFKWNFFSK